MRDVPRGPLLMPGEAAGMLGVHVKTLTRWAKAGNVPHVFTHGGHRRYRYADIHAIVEAAYRPARDRALRDVALVVSRTLTQAPTVGGRMSQGVLVEG